MFSPIRLMRAMLWVFSPIYCILSFTPRKHHHHSPRAQRTRKLCVREQYFRKKLSGSRLTFSLELCGFSSAPTTTKTHSFDFLRSMLLLRSKSIVRTENDQQLRNIRRAREKTGRTSAQIFSDKEERARP